MELILSEEQYNKFYNILKEQPTGLVKNIASVLTKSKLNRVTMSKIQNLITKKKLSSPLPINKINTSRKIINRLVKGELNPQDTIEVLKVLFKNETSNKELLESIANYIVKNDQSIVNFKGKNKEEIISILKPKYGDEQSKILADKIYSYDFKPGFRQGMKRGIIHTPYKSIVKIISPFHKLSNEEWRRLVNWFAFGTTITRKELILTYQKLGLKGVAISLGGEWLGRYLKLIGTLTAIKFIFKMANENKMPGDKYPNMSDWEIAAKRVEESLTIPEAKWVIPSIVSWPIVTNILSSLNRGTGLDGVYNNFENWINKTKNKISDMKKEVELIKPLPRTQPNDISNFKNYIIKSWGSDYKEGNVTFYKKGDYYIANDKTDNLSYLYIKNNNSFEYVPQ